MRDYLERRKKGRKKEEGRIKRGRKKRRKKRDKIHGCLRGLFLNSLPYMNVDGHNREIVILFGFRYFISAPIHLNIHVAIYYLKSISC